MKVSLSAKGIQNIPFEQYEKDFSFIVDGKKIKINRFLADFISPKISRIHQIDPTISSFCIGEDMTELAPKTNFKDKEEEEGKGNNTKRVITKEILEEFLEIGKGKVIDIDIEESKLEIYEKMSIILENEEIYEQIEEHFIKKNEININNLIFLLQILEKKEEESNNIIKLKEKRILEYLSSHFYEILKDKEKREKMKEMKTDTIYEIIKKEKLVIEEENDLMEFIIEMIENNKENTILLENIRFEMISETTFEKLMTIFDPNEMTIEIWNKMKKCFHPKKGECFENDKEKRNLNKGKLFQFINNDKLEGIISYLTKKSGGNIHKNGTIEVTSSSCAHSSLLPENVIDIENKRNIFQSSIKANSWICFNFKGMKVNLSNYTITSRYDCNNYYPQTWVIEGSNEEGNNWEIIDEKKKGERGDFTEALQNLTFSIERKGKSEKYYQYIRFRQTGPDSGGTNYFTFTAIEFYGNLEE